MPNDEHVSARLERRRRGELEPGAADGCEVQLFNLEDIARRHEALAGDLRTQAARLARLANSLQNGPNALQAAELHQVRVEALYLADQLDELGAVRVLAEVQALPGSGVSFVAAVETQTRRLPVTHPHHVPDLDPVT